MDIKGEEMKRELCVELDNITDRINKCRHKLMIQTVGDKDYSSNNLVDIFEDCKSDLLEMVL